MSKRKDALKNVLQALRAYARTQNLGVFYFSRNFLVNNPHLYGKKTCRIFEHMPPISSSGVMQTGEIGSEFDPGYFFTTKLFSWNKQDGYKTLNLKTNNAKRVVEQQDDESLESGSLSFYKERIDTLKRSFKYEVTHIGIVIQYLGLTPESRIEVVRILKIEDIQLFGAE